MSQNCISLLNNEGTLTESFRRLLKEVFIKYDLDKDGILNKEELKYYFSSVSDGPYDDSGMDLIMLCMCGRTDRFTLEDFYTFYEFQSRHNSYEVLDDLLRLYSKDVILERLKPSQL
ncbi:hypothetical protein PIROE2DRAFT_18955 [Piromyces sp. E2]|nr:hypothetical protein PIROE2DRAFT_18955 [Piromyces sp. E2]|eukprot:OUM56443.1 hypothetical protein PIROE2DRAFT_18955 [Piromyces sp. E2]